MARKNAKVVTLTIRLDADLKADLAKFAHEESRPIVEVVRLMIRESVKQRKQSRFLKEARRESLELARAAEDPKSDESAILRELWNAYCAHCEDEARTDTRDNHPDQR